MVEREGQIVHNAVRMVVPVCTSLHPHAETLQAQVVVQAYGALYPHGVADILLAVVAVVQCLPAGADGICLCSTVHVQHTPQIK